MFRSNNQTIKQSNIQAIRQFSLFALLGFALSASASPLVTIERIQQRYPWNGLVDIDYTVTGVDNPAAYSLSLAVGGETMEGEPIAQPCEHFSGAAACDLPLETGVVNRVTWDANADDCTFVSTSLTVTATISYTPYDETLGDFAIIDISSGATSTNYPVKFVKGSDTSVFNTDTYKTTKIVLRRIPAGTFRMGDENDLGENASFGHYVKLTKDYYIGVFPLTVKQAVLIGGNAYSTYTEFSSNDDVDVCPAENIDRGVAYASSSSIVSNLCKKANCRGRTLVFSPPTEAQWEKAARCGTLTKYYYGSTDTTVLTNYAWYSANSDNRTHPVGLKIPNGYGLYDLYGNTREWTTDGAYDYEAGTADSPLVDPYYPITVNDSPQYVRRGGYFSHGTGPCSSGHRITGGPEGNNGRSGIRLALWLE